MHSVVPLQHHLSTPRFPVAPAAQRLALRPQSRRPYVTSALPLGQDTVSLRFQGRGPSRLKQLFHALFLSAFLALAGCFSPPAWGQNVRILSSSRQVQLSYGNAYTDAILNELRKPDVLSLEQAQGNLEAKGIYLENTEDGPVTMHPVSSPNRLNGFVKENHIFTENDPRRPMAEFLLDHYDVIAGYAEATGAAPPPPPEGGDPVGAFITMSDLEAYVKAVSPPEIAPVPPPWTPDISQGEKDAGKINMYEVLKLIELRGDKNPWGDPLHRISKPQLENLKTLFSEDDLRQQIIDHLLTHFDQYSASSTLYFPSLQGGGTEPTAHVPISSAPPASEANGPKDPFVSPQADYITRDSFMAALARGDSVVINPGPIVYPEPRIEVGPGQWSLEDLRQLIVLRGDLNRFGDPHMKISRAHLERLVDPARETGPVPTRFMVLAADGSEPRFAEYIEEAEIGFQEIFKIPSERVLKMDAASPESIEKELDKIKAYADGHPNESIEVLFLYNGHGSGTPSLTGSEQEGDYIGGSQIGLNEEAIKAMIAERFPPSGLMEQVPGQSRVKVYLMFDTCYSGSWIADQEPGDIPQTPHPA